MKNQWLCYDVQPISWGFLTIPHLWNLWATLATFHPMAQIRQAIMIPKYEEILLIRSCLKIAMALP